MCLSGNIFILKIKCLLITAWVPALGQIFYKGEGDIAVAALIGRVITTQIEKMMSVKTGITNDNRLISQQLASQLR